MILYMGITYDLYQHVYIVVTKIIKDGNQFGMSLRKLTDNLKLLY
jgi:hypothetical protein